MSAILGRIEFSGRPVDKNDFRTATAALAHYGADGTGVLIEGSVALGHHHLKVARRSAPEVQPLRLGSLLIVADAILDNRKGLAEALRLTPAEADTLPDSALILRAYRKWGADCLDHFLGDYAFAIFDGEKRRLFLARDHIGARPLYWFHHGDTVLFATDIRGLVAFDDINWPIDDALVARYLRNPNEPMTTGFFQGVRILEPGHHLVIDAGGSAEQRWWNPANAKSVRFKRHEDYLERFRELIETSVNDRVDTDFGVSSHISGGIDSTSVTALAARRLRTKGRTLSSAVTWAPPISDQYPDMGPGDERRIIAEICAREGIDCHYGTASGHHFHSYLSWEMELDGTADLWEEIPTLEKTSTGNVRVLLSGWGGDEAFSARGLGYLAHLLKRGHFGRSYRVARAMSGRRHPAILARVFWEYGIVPMLPGQLYNLFSPFHEIYSTGSFISPSLSKQFFKQSKEKRKGIRLLPDPGDYLRALLLNGHLGARMATWAAWSAAYGVQHRYPLTDRRVIEFVLGTPYEQFFFNGKDRYFSKSALHDCLAGQPRKYDTANEKFRRDQRAGCWALLADDLRSSRLDGPCDWLDMPALREAINDVPNMFGTKEVIAFANLCAAMRIWHMYQRHKPNLCSNSTKGNGESQQSELA